MVIDRRQRGRKMIFSNRKLDILRNIPAYFIKILNLDL